MKVISAKRTADWALQKGSHSQVVITVRQPWDQAISLLKNRANDVGYVCLFSDEKKGLFIYEQSKSILRGRWFFILKVREQSTGNLKIDVGVRAATFSVASFGIVKRDNACKAIQQLLVGQIR
jgi:hypothetical protein